MQENVDLASIFKVVDKKALTTFEVFCEAAKLYPETANIWLNSLARISAIAFLK